MSACKPFHPAAGRHCTRPLAVTRLTGERVLSFICDAAMMSSATPQRHLTASENGQRFYLFLAETKQARLLNDAFVDQA